MLARKMLHSVMPANLSNFDFPAFWVGGHR